MATGVGAEQGRRVTAVLREGGQVTPLELFFDLVFVLAITQCTALMAGDPTWEGLGKGILVLGMLWWAWVGYAWLTSVVDPEEGVVRIAIFAAMAALLVVSLCVPQAFGDLGLTFAIFYGLVRAGQLALFVVASRDAPTLRHSIWIGLVPGTGAGVALRWPPPCGGPTSTWWPSWPSGGSAARKSARSRTSWRATRTRSSTSRWWPAWS